nr:MAG TPA: hypothetical protein [Caudoviricetes sp.]
MYQRLNKSSSSFQKQGLITVISEPNPSLL